MDNINICDNLLSYYPISNFIPGSPNDIGIFMFSMGITYIIMSFLTIAFIKSQEVKAYEHSNDMDQNNNTNSSNNNTTVKISNIFPVFVKVLWLSALGSVAAGIIVCFVPFAPLNNNSILSSICYAFISAFRHGITEGIAFLLMQKGCGKYAARTVLQWVLLWSFLIFSLKFIIYFKHTDIGDAIELIIDAIVFLFYLSLWLAPQKLLFRRPAVYIYARFWTYFRLASVIIKLLYFFRTTEDIGACGYLFSTILLLAIFQPLICYWTLLRDSDWWQGIDINQGGRQGSYEDIRSPLVGIDFNLHTAQSLAHIMDHIRFTNSVKMINFANLKVNHSKHLGSGSFSKVYQGYYQKKECAVKMIYTYDLTEDVIRRIAAEASILSSIKHPNVVHIYGVTVLPPSVCIVLDLCQYGSLSDIIRGYGFDWNPNYKITKIMSISRTDRMYLALGCARGVAAIHSYDSYLSHKDIKSFNFLVDSQFTVKIADLELGTALIGIDEGDSNHVIVDNMLANWMPPELLQMQPYTQKSDVYSLAMVLWEIVSDCLPFDTLTQDEIRIKLRSGYRHILPKDYDITTAYGQLITRAWSEEPNDRPTSSEIVSQLEVILQDICYRVISDTDITTDINPVIEYYKKWKLYTENGIYSLESNNHAIDFSYRSEQNSDNILSLVNMNSNIDGNANLNQNTKDRLSWWSRPSDASNSYSQSTSSPSYKSLPFFGGIGLSGKLNGNLFGSPQKQTNSSNSLSHQTPSYVLDIIGSVQEYRGWLSLETTGQAWAVFTYKSPHILVYSTTSWNHLFGLQNDQDNITIKAFKDFTYDMNNITDMENIVENGKNNTLNTKSTFGNGINNSISNKISSCLSMFRKKATIGAEISRYSSICSDISVNSSHSDPSISADTKDSQSIVSSLMRQLSINNTQNSNNNNSNNIAIDTKITESYISSCGIFLNQLHNVHEAHGIVLMGRKVRKRKRNIPFLCSLHAYGIYPSSVLGSSDRNMIDSNMNPKKSSKKDQSNSNNNIIGLRPNPIYFAILFNELKHEIHIPSLSIIDNNGNDNSKNNHLTNHHDLFDQYECSIPIEVSTKPMQISSSSFSSSLPSSQKASSIGSYFSLLSQSSSSSSTSLSNTSYSNKSGHHMDSSKTKPNIVLKQPSLLLSPQDFDHVEESWIE